MSNNSSLDYYKDAIEDSKKKNLPINEDWLLRNKVTLEELYKIMKDSSNMFLGVYDLWFNNTYKE
jgi:hypothetical protein